MHNSSKFNVNEYNTSKNNISNDNNSIGNESISNQSNYNKTIGNESYNNLQKDTSSINTHSKDIISEDIISKGNRTIDTSSVNMHSANKIDTSHLKREGFTQQEDAYGSITTDNASGEITGLRTNTVDSLVETSKNYNQENNRGVSEAKHFEVGGSIGNRGGKSTKQSNNLESMNSTQNIEEKKGVGKILSGAVDTVKNLVSMNAGGGYNESLTKSSIESSGIHTVDRREEQEVNKAMIQGSTSAKEAIERLNQKYNLEEVGKATAPVVETTDKVISSITNIFKVDEKKNLELSKELDEFAEMEKNKK